MLKFDTLDSTNNYAMHLIDADKAEHGMTILTDIQTAGKGQRGKSWDSKQGTSLLMSLIVKPVAGLHEQAYFLAAVAEAVAEVVEDSFCAGNVKIKWPNDIVIGDKKAGGILIENIVRGSTWAWAVVGIGINVSQTEFHPDLPHATSLVLEGATDIDISGLAARLRDRILGMLDSPDVALNAYNARLYKRGMHQKFRSGEHFWTARILAMSERGVLQVVTESNEREEYNHGSVEWVWDVPPGRSAAEFAADA